MIAVTVTIVILALIAGYCVALYNDLIRERNQVKLAWSNIDVLLAQRHGKFPKLVDVCKRYMQHEQQTLEQAVQARSAVDTARGLQRRGEFAERTDRRSVRLRTGASAEVLGRANRRRGSGRRVREMTPALKHAYDALVLAAFAGLGALYASWQFFRLVRREKHRAALAFGATVLLATLAAFLAQRGLQAYGAATAPPALQPG